ncbi:MAG: LysM domain-containing protein [Pseudomonadota bacterium]
MVAVVATLVACAPAPTVEETVPAPVAAKPRSYEPTPDLTPRQRLLRSFELLEEGDADQARVEVVAYLERVPNSSIAKDLLLQIDTDPNVFYPAAYREIRLQPGQSLSNVAKEYLGSAFDFYALARYNNIERPRRVVPGQIVRVPLTPEAIAVFAGTADAEGADSPMATEAGAEALAGDGTASEALDAGLGEALGELDSLEGGAAGEAIASEAATEAAAITEEALASEEAPGAVIDTESSEMASEIAPGIDTELASEIATEIDVDMDAELEAEIDSATSDIENTELETAVAAPDPQLDLDALHREAINAYRSQDLDRAIGLWNRILAADPGYESALLYRSQAEALKERLKRLQ